MFSVVYVCTLRMHTHRVRTAILHICSIKWNLAAKYKGFFKKTNENTLRDKQTNKGSETQKHRRSSFVVEKLIFFQQKRAP